MKKIVFLIVLTLIGTVCFAQRGGSSRGSNVRGSSPTRSSVSSRPSSPSRSSISTSRTTTYSPSRSTSVRSNEIRRSETRSATRMTNPTTTVRNTPRSQNNGVNRPHVSHRPSSHGAPVYNHPHPRHHHNVTHHRHHVPHGMHPMPPMHHPIHHRPINMRYHLYHRDYWFVHNLYWYGYWSYVHTYPYNEVIIYMNNTRPGTETLAITTDENYVYTIYKDNYMNETYFTISDRDDNVLVKTVVHKKYCKLVPDGNGVWLLKNNDKDPMFFMYQDGNLYRYEED